MICFNCGKRITSSDINRCPNCAAIINSTKSNFISYIGPEDKLSGYQRSYKLLLLKYIIEELLSNKEAIISNVISNIRLFYINRKNNGLEPDYNVDIRISNIETSTDYDIFSVFKSLPYKVINEKGYLFINKNSKGNLIFTFNENIVNSMSKNEWEKLLNIINKKIVLYYSSLDCKLTDKSKNNECYNNNSNLANTDISNIPLNLNVQLIECDGLSSRAKNILMRNNIFTVNELINFVKTNNLGSFKNIGERTIHEISEFLSYINKNQNHKQKQSFDLSKYAIRCYFSDNKYNLFLDYCNKNNLIYLSDLGNFDFNILIQEPGFGIGKLNKVIHRYNEIINGEVDLELQEQNSNKFNIVEESIKINPTNMDLNISYLTYAKITNNAINILLDAGYNTIGNLNGITLSTLISLMGKTRSINIFNKLKTFNQSLKQILLEFIEKNKSESIISICSDRANNKTLQEVANKYNLSRERIRQLENKFLNKLNPLITSIILQEMKNNSTNYISEAQIFDALECEEYYPLLLHTLITKSDFEYLKFANIFLINHNGTQNVEEKLAELSKELIGSEGFNFLQNLNIIEEMLNDNNLEFISVDSYLTFLIDNLNAHIYGEYIFLEHQTYSNLCVKIVKKYFKDGIKLSSDDDINLLRTYFHKEFGEFELPENNHSLATRLSEHLIMCDRGKFTTIENMYYDQSIIDEIKDFIDNSELKSLYFSEIFVHYQGVLAFTSNINNEYALHGIFTYLYKNEYIFSRTQITKKDGNGISISIEDRINKLIISKGECISKNEIKQNIAGLSDFMISNFVFNSDYLIQWEFGKYNSMQNLSINEEESDSLHILLDEILETNNGYSSEELFYKSVSSQMPNFISKNKINNSSNLFYIINNLYKNEYEFSRPHICKKGIVKNVTTKDIALYLLGDTRTFTKERFNTISKNMYWSQFTAYLIFQEIEKDYIRISNNNYIRYDLFHINDSVLEMIKSALLDLISNDNYISMINLNNFDNFPTIEYEWNNFLLISIIKRYDLGFKCISPEAKDSRYNKEIIVKKSSDFNCYGDIVYYQLLTANIDIIDENNLLSFLIINNLARKCIPKELYKYKKLNYNNGYFKM